MLSPDDSKVAQELKRRLLGEGVPILEALVFGSRARGDHVPESDLDIFLVLDHVDERIQKDISRIAWEVGFEHDRIITTVDYTREQLENSPLRASPFVRTVQDEGISI